MKTKLRILIFALSLMALLLPCAALAADADIDIEAEIIPQIMQESGEAEYRWRLTNNSPYDIKGVYVFMDGGAVRYISELEAGESFEESGRLRIEKEDIGRRIEFSASGYADLPEERETEKGKKSVKVTEGITASCSVLVCAPGSSVESHIPSAPVFVLPPEEETKPESKLYAFATLDKKVAGEGEENVLRVFVKNEGNTELSGFELMLGKESVALLDALSPGYGAELEYSFSSDKDASLSPLLKYIDGNGKKKQKKLGTLRLYLADTAIKLSLSLKDEQPNPRDKTPVYIEISNTGEKSISGLQLFDFMQNPVLLTSKKLKSGESMKVLTYARLSRAEEIMFYALGKSGGTVAASSEPKSITPFIPPETAGIKLILNPNKRELSGNGSDMIVCECKAVNTGSYALSGLCVMQDGKVIGSKDLLPAGASADFIAAVKLNGAAELSFSASAADETGALRESHEILRISAGEKFIRE